MLAHRIVKMTAQFEHEVVSIFPGSAIDEFQRDGVRVEVILKKKPRGLRGVVNKNFALNRFLRNHQYDIIHFHGGGISILLFLVLLKSKTRIIFHLHSGNITGIPFKLGLPIIYKLLYKLIDPRLEKVATCEHVKQFYTKEIKSAKTGLIHLIKNFTPFDFIPKEKLNITIGYIGRVSHEKGVQLFFDLIEDPIYKQLNLKTVLMGDVSNGIAKLIDERKSGGMIEFLSPKLNVEEFYNKVDILVFTSSLTETLPLVILEAASFDVAVIALRTNATEELLGDYPLLVDQYDVAHFLEKLNQYYSEVDCRITVRKIHQEVANKFNRKEYYSRIVELYQLSAVK